MAELDDKLINYAGLQHFHDRMIDDAHVSEEATWSSQKINSELEALAGDANSEIVVAETIDVTFVNAVPTEAGEDGQYVIYVTESEDTLYKYENGAWAVQTIDANKLYYDTEHDVMYAYKAATHKFAEIGIDNTIIFSGSITSNAAKTALNPIKTPGVYNVLQHQTSSGKTKMTNWVMTVTFLDSDEADELDGSVYQKLENNYTVYKRYYKPSTDTWTTMTKYYEGLVRDSLTSSAYYSWSVNKIKSAIAAAIAEVPQLGAGKNISVEDGKINALGYKTSKNAEFSIDNGYFGSGLSEYSVHNPTESVSVFFYSEYPASMFPVPIKLTGVAGATSYVVDATGWSFVSSIGEQLIGYIFNTSKGGAKVSGIDTTNTSLIFESTINASEALVEEVVTSLAIQNHIYLSGPADATTYNLSDGLGASDQLLSFLSGICGVGVFPEIKIAGYENRTVLSADSSNGTVTLDKTLNAESAVSNVELLSFVDDLYTYDNFAISYNSHAEGFGTYAGRQIYITPLTYDSQTGMLTTTQDLSQYLNASGALKVFIPGDESKVITINHVRDLGGGVYRLVPQNSVNLSDGTYSGILNYGQFAHAEGLYAKASGEASHAEGLYAKASGSHSHAEGADTTAQNQSEHAEGTYNVSHKASDTYGNAGNTQHSVGIGAFRSRKNAFEIMQNGDMYVYGVGNYDGTTIKAAGNSVQTLKDVLDAKADTYEVATNAEIDSLFA